MTPIQEVYKTLKFVSDAGVLTSEQAGFIEPVLKEEINAREAKRMQYLLVRSGLKPIKRLEDFDWKFNPRIPVSGGLNGANYGGGGSVVKMALR